RGEIVECELDHEISPNQLLHILRIDWIPHWVLSWIESRSNSESTRIPDSTTNAANSRTERTNRSLYFSLLRSRPQLHRLRMIDDGRVRNPQTPDIPRSCKIG